MFIDTKKVEPQTGSPPHNFCFFGLIIASRRVQTPIRSTEALSRSAQEADNEMIFPLENERNPHRLQDIADECIRPGLPILFYFHPNYYVLVNTARRCNLWDLQQRAWE